MKILFRFSSNKQKYGVTNHDIVEGLGKDCEDILDVVLLLKWEISNLSSNPTIRRRLGISGWQYIHYLKEQTNI